VHKLLGEESAGVNLVAEDESELEEEEDEDWWVSIVEVMEVLNEGGKTLEVSDESVPEGETQFITSTRTRKDDSRLEDEFEYPVDTHYPEEGWWSPEPPRPDSEEEVQCLVQVLGLGPRGVEPTLGEAVAGPREDVTAPD
jgi:hypothetical protein